MIGLITSIVTAIAGALPQVLSIFGSSSSEEELAALDAAIADMVAARDAGRSALRKLAADTDAELDAVEAQRNKPKEK